MTEAAERVRALANYVGHEPNINRSDLEATVLEEGRIILAAAYRDGFRDALTQTGVTDEATAKKIFEAAGITWKAAR